MKLKFSRQTFKKYSNIKFHELEAELFHANGRTDGQIGITKLIVAICNLRTHLKSVWYDDSQYAENLKTRTSKEQMVDAVTHKNIKIVLKTIKNGTATRPGEINAAILKYGVLMLTLRFHLINTNR
jgi:hypothetical protein